MTTVPLADAYRDAIRDSLLIQLVVAILLMLLLDGGRLAMVGGCAMAGFWIGAAIVMWRRPRSPRALDLLFIRWGFVPILVAAFAIGAAINR
jgi:hypothetical protein